ncbi:FAD binding domain-containing protein [Bremerella cremea]|uniref:FAD binding domain-containing protein n=1 Tax=Bremerella cremea TaxID=1031537 RepID=UPI0031EA5141
MQSFTYHAPRTIPEAVALLTESEGKSVLLAGGTDILVQLRENLRHADHVIDIKQIQDLARLDGNAKQGLYLGSAVTCSQLLRSPITQPYAALRDSAQIIGGWQIQSRATIGGNLCNSSPAADSIPSLMVHGAVAEVINEDGHQNIPVSHFCTGPGKNALAGNGLLLGLAIPEVGTISGSAYQRFIPRYEMDIAVASAASYIELLEDGTVATATIALGAVGPTPLLASDAADMLVGETPEEALIEQIAQEAARIATPINDMRGTIEFRKHLASVLVKRTLQTALRRATGEVVVSHPHV